MTHEPQKDRPIFDKGIPIPSKQRSALMNQGRTVVVGQEQFSVSLVLAAMQVGDSCLLSNWAPTSVNYVQKKTPFRYQREVQPDGNVRVWRVK